VARTQTSWPEWLLGKGDEENKEQNEFSRAMQDDIETVQSSDEKAKVNP